MSLSELLSEFMQSKQSDLNPEEIRMLKKILVENPEKQPIGNDPNFPPHDTPLPPLDRGGMDRQPKPFGMK